MPSALRNRASGDTSVKCPICNDYRTTVVGGHPGQVNDVREIFGVTAECPICLDVCSTLMALPCGHILCKDDYQRMSRTKPASFASLARPDYRNHRRRSDVFIANIVGARPTAHSTATTARLSESEASRSTSLTRHSARPRGRYVPPSMREATDARAVVRGRYVPPSMREATDARAVVPALSRISETHRYATSAARNNDPTMAPTFNEATTTNVVVPPVAVVSERVTARSVSPPLTRAVSNGIIYFIVGVTLWGNVPKHLRESSQTSMIPLVLFYFGIFVLLELTNGQTSRSVLTIPLAMVCIPYIYSIWIFSCIDIVVRLKFDILLELRLIWAFGTVTLLIAFAGIGRWFACGASLDSLEFIFIMCGVCFCHYIIFDEVTQLRY